MARQHQYKRLDYHYYNYILCPGVNIHLQIINNIKTKAMKHLNKSILIVLVFLFNKQYCSAQNNHLFQKGNFGFAANASVSADRFGGQYSPMFYYKKGRRSIFMGPIIQNKNLNLSGLQLSYDYTLAGKDVIGSEPYNENLELFCFITSIYHCNATLGKSAVWEEKRAYNGYEGDPAKLRFKSIELYAGGGLKLKLFSNIKWMNSIGFGGYTSFNVPKTLCYENKSVGLLLKSGISFDF